jgi:hypothetical protein
MAASDYVSMDQFMHVDLTGDTVTWANPVDLADRSEEDLRMTWLMKCLMLCGGGGEVLDFHMSSRSNMLRTTRI